MIIDILKAIILGAVEGLTEFLPISSTGHLILVNQWLSFSPSFTKIFDIVIQLGAILAVVAFFWKRLFNPAIWTKTIIAVIPAIILGGLFGNLIENSLFHPTVVATTLILGGLFLIYIEKRQIKPRYNSITQIPWTTALAIGLIQCLSMIPGTSRSAATIIGAIILGASRATAVEFSFFLAIPTMIAATGYSLLKHHAAIGGSEYILLVIGLTSAFFVALAVIKFFVNFIKRHNLIPFAYYRLVLGTLVLIYFLLK